MCVLEILPEKADYKLLYSHINDILGNMNTTTKYEGKKSVVSKS